MTQDDISRMTENVIGLAVQQGVETIIIDDITGIREGNSLGKTTNQKFHFKHSS